MIFIIKHVSNNRIIKITIFIVVISRNTEINVSCLITNEDRVRNQAIFYVNQTRVVYQKGKSSCRSTYRTAMVGHNSCKAQCSVGSIYLIVQIHSSIVWEWRAVTKSIISYTILKNQEAHLVIHAKFVFMINARFWRIFFYSFSFRVPC